MKRRDAKARQKRSAYDTALAMLARREHSARELVQRLERKGYSRDELEQALRRLVEDGYQDDHRFGEMLVRSRIGQAYGPNRIRAELRSHGLPDDAVEQLLSEAEADIDWQAEALALLRRRYGEGEPADFQERGKRAQFLLRRGFPAAIVSRVTRMDPV